jgi:TatD DNase family protein
MLIDTHCHLNFPQYAGSKIENILGRAAQNEVRVCLNVGSDLTASQASVNLAQKHPEIYASVGVHPHDAETGEKDLAELEKLITKNKVVAVGEIGLDYYKDLSPRDKQKTLFEKQIELGLKYQKPLIIHCREANQDTYDILTHYKPGKVVFHCFAGNKDFAKKVFDLGYLISFTGNITFPKSFKAQEVIQYAPLDRIMVETDCPFMAPVPHRGTTNEPSYVKYVAEKIAELKQITFAEVAEITTQNAKNFFGLK